MDDNENVVDYPTVKKLNAIMRVFVSDYLELAWGNGGEHDKINEKKKHAEL